MDELISTTVTVKKANRNEDGSWAVVFDGCDFDLNLPHRAMISMGLISYDDRPTSGLYLSRRTSTHLARQWTGKVDDVQAFVGGRACSESSDGWLMIFMPEQTLAIEPDGWIALELGTSKWSTYTNTEFGEMLRPA